MSRRRLAALLSGVTVGEGIRVFFKTVLDELDDPATPRICLLAGSLSSDVLSERDLKRFVVSEMNAFAECFTQRLMGAKEAGELPRNFNVEAATQILITYLQGLFRVAGVLQSRAEIERQIEVLLNGLGL